MNKKWLRVCFTFLLVAFLFVLLFSSVYCTQSPSNELAQSELEVRRQVSKNILNIDFWVFLAQRYEFFDVDIRHEVTVEITTSLTEPPATPYVISAEIPFHLTDVGDLPSGVNYTYGFWGYPPTGTLSIYLPAYTSYFSIKLVGYLSGKSILWRNTAETPSLNITSPVTPASSYRLILVPPSPSRFLRVYSRLDPYLRYQETSVDGQRCIVVSGTRVPIAVLYEPTSWEVYALFVMLITIFVFYMIPYVIESRKIRAKTSNSITTFRQGLPPKPIGFLKRLYNGISKLDSSNLLAAFILCGLLMISLCFIAGPEPRLKVYVLASTPETARTISDFVRKERGAVAITTFDEMSEFRSLGELGVFSAAIVGDFFPPSEKTVKLEIYPALDVIRSIIILKQYAFADFSFEIQRRYADKTIIIEDLADLTPALVDIERRTNALGLNVSPATYTEVSAFVGLCSLIIVFFGFAFLSCKLIEVGKKPGVGGFPEAIAYSIFYFVFTQMIYIVCSVLLAMPLGLHTSSPKVTAIGFMGFGGGSRPRLYAGFAGFLFGSLISLKEGLKLEKVGFISFLAVSFFIVVDPLTSGIIFYEFVLLYTVGPPYFETGVITQSYIKTFLAEIGVALGGWASPIYGISTGTILYYAGAIPFCLFPKLNRSTATVLLFFCAFCAASGGIRLADMRPWTSIASLIPGVMTGFVFAALFSLISVTETIIRTKIGKGKGG